jgi:hypothetical protein
MTPSDVMFEYFRMIIENRDNGGHEPTMLCETNDSELQSFFECSEIYSDKEMKIIPLNPPRKWDSELQSELETLITKFGDEYKIADLFVI